MATDARIASPFFLLPEVVDVQSTSHNQGQLCCPLEEAAPSTLLELATNKPALSGIAQRWSPSLYVSIGGVHTHIINTSEKWEDLQCTYMHMQPIQHADTRALYNEYKIFQFQQSLRVIKAPWLHHTWTKFPTSLLKCTGLLHTSCCTARIPITCIQESKYN